MTASFEVTEDDIIAALLSVGIDVTYERATELMTLLDHQAVADAARYDGDLDEATERADEEIRRQLRERMFIERDVRQGSDDPAYQIIVRAIHERGERQRIALRHLAERGLWLSPAQKLQAGL